jgi:hypothetical protein
MNETVYDLIVYTIAWAIIILGGYAIRPWSERTYKVNGYKIRYNDYYKKWQTSHDEIGVCEEFVTLKEAKNYCRKG